MKISKVETKRERFVSVDLQKTEEGYNVLRAFLKDNPVANVDEFPGYY